MMDFVRIPLSSQDLTAPWLQQVLRLSGRSAHLIVSSVKVQEGYQKGKGELSCMLKVEAEVQEDGMTRQEHYVAKVLPDLEVMRKYVVESEADVTEIRAYKEVLTGLMSVEEQIGCPALHTFLPKYIYSNFDHKESDPRSIILLEDLGVQGFSNVDLYKGLDVSHACLAARCLAHLHAASYAWQSGLSRSVREECPFIFTFFKTSEVHHAAAYDGFRRFCVLQEKYPQLSALQDKLTKMVDDFPEHLTKLKEMEVRCDKWLVVTQFDFYGNNFMFKMDPADGSLHMKLVDWQMLALTFPFVPLVTMFLSSTTEECRENHLEDVLSAYWDAFSSRCQQLQLDSPQTREQFMEELNLHGWKFGLLWCMTVGKLFYSHSQITDRLVNVVMWLSRKGIF